MAETSPKGLKKRTKREPLTRYDGVKTEYEGAKEMLLADNADSRDSLIQLLTATYDELPAPKTKKR